jgi:hypothetical protein
MTIKFEFAGTIEAERGLGGVILWLTYKQWTDVQASGKGGCHLRGKIEKNREKKNFHPPVIFTFVLRDFCRIYIGLLFFSFVIIFVFCRN